jgi:hypothetical protein
MANRTKKLKVESVDNEIAEVDNLYMVSSNPNTSKVAIGETVYVNLPMFSRRLKALRLEQHAKGLLGIEEMNKGYFMLNDGTILKPDKTYEVVMTQEIKDMLRWGILRGGGRMHGGVKKTQMVTVPS